jgi:hypothetical protein
MSFDRILFILTTKIIFMKSIILVTLSFFISFLFSAQTIYKDYQDGIIIFQLKVDKSFKIFPSLGGEVAFKSVPLLNKMNSKYKFEKVIQLYPNHKNELLERTYQINFLDPHKIDQFIKELAAFNEIEYAERKELHHTTLTPNDPGYTNSTSNGQWALFQINAAQAWDISTGSSGTVVAVTDNAININHPDLINKMLPGHDAVDNDSDPSPCGSNDGFHGSHVSGIVGAESNNNLGIASIGYDVSILPVKIGDCNGSLTGGFEGIVWAADNGADVINMSWGGSGSSTYGQNVCDYAWNQGSILIAAAGNDGVNSVFYPAGYNNVVSVASTTTGDVKSGFSNYGAWIDISAPGSSILSTNAGTGYQVTQGTSMASPLVAGLVGLMKSHATGASNTDILNCLYSSATNIDGANSNFVGQLGAGRINAHQAMICSNNFAYQLDAGIASIEAPNGNLCGDTYSPQVIVRNFGSNTLTTLTITYQVSGSPAQVFNWSGNLSTGQSEIVTFPAITSSSGSYVFTATSSLPNGNTDQNTSNDQTTANFSIIPNGDQVNLSILTDCYGSEISWSVTDNQSTVVASGGSYADVAGGQLESATICLAPGCYTFNIADSYGDGLNGSQWNTCAVNGDYYMEDSNGNRLFSMTVNNGNFGNGTSHTFCIASPLADDAGIVSISSPVGTYCNSSISPSVAIQNLGNQNLTSCVINYQVTGGTLQTFNWTGTLTSNQTAVVALPVMNAINGINNFIAYTTLPNGNVDANNLNDSSSTNFTVYSSGLNLPFTEDFENGFSNQNWSIVNPDGGITWELATIAGTTPGNQAAKMDFFNYGQQGQRDFITTPMLDLSNQNTVNLYFEYAYRRYDQNTTDSLILLISTDCGQTYSRLLALGENGTGSFATAVTSLAAFTPGAGNWCTGSVGADCFNVDLSSYAGQSNVFIRFQGYNAGTTGNNLFIDNINITGDFVSNCPELTTSKTDVSCFGASNGLVNISSTNGVAPFTYSLDNITYGSNTSFSGLSQGTYNAFVKGADGCVDSLQFLINEPSAIVINAVPTDADCGQTNGQISVNATGGTSAYQYSIDGGSTYSSLSSYSSLAAGSYSVFVQDANSCVQSTSTTIVSNASFTLSTSGNQSICIGDAVIISASGVPSGGSYTWGQGVGNGSTHSVSPTLSTTYTVTGTDLNGCTSTETLDVIVNSVPSVSITPTSASICDGETTTLIASGAQTYSWNGGSTGNTLTVSPNSTTTYTVIGQNGTCTSLSTSQTINVSPTPTVTANANNTSVLINESVNFDVNGSNANNYGWDFGDGSSSSIANISHSYSSVGTYVVTLTGELNGCSATANVTIMVGDAIGLEENLSWSAGFYPNPSDGILTIQTSRAVGQTELNVFDVQGKLVLPPIYINSNESIKIVNFSDLNEGVYILSFINGNERLNKRMSILK